MIPDEIEYGVNTRDGSLHRNQDCSLGGGPVALSFAAGSVALRAPLTLTAAYGRRRGATPLTPPGSPPCDPPPGQPANCPWHDGRTDGRRTEDGRTDGRRTEDGRTTKGTGPWSRTKHRDPVREIPLVLDPPGPAKVQTRSPAQGWPESTGTGGRLPVGTGGRNRSD